MTAAPPSNPGNRRIQPRVVLLLAGLTAFICISVILTDIYAMRRHRIVLMNPDAVPASQNANPGAPQ